jgi:hypothetical protein
VTARKDGHLKTKVMYLDICEKCKTKLAVITNTEGEKLCQFCYEDYIKEKQKC